MNGPAGRSRRAVGGLGALRIGMLAFLCACDSPGKREARQLAAAVERFEAGDNVQRAQLAADVAAIPCTDPTVSPACAACVRATRATARALLRKNEVEDALGELDAGRLSEERARAMDLGARLDEATRNIEEARVAMPDCETQIAALRRAHGI